MKVARHRLGPRVRDTDDRPREILDAAGILRLQQTVTEVYVDPRLISYAVGLVEATRKLTYWGAPELEGYVSYGASPRGSINLIHAARAMALLHGRRYVLAQDIIALAPDVLRHRLVLSYAALADGVTADTIVERVISLVPAPRLEMAVEPTA